MTSRDARRSTDGRVTSHGRVPGLDGYEAAMKYHLWFRAYDNPRPKTPTHSVHILLPTAEPGRYTLAHLWQGSLAKLLKDAIAQGYLTKVPGYVAPVQLDLFDLVG
ncbi:MAG: hypothetical protein JWL97_4241 [Gemmatimonadales bacterium]|nr:hypothetical protein [Gemmatimonadales bacterium]